MRKSMIAAIALAGVVMPFTSAQADHACGNVIIFSSPVGANAGAGRCLAEDVLGVDGKDVHDNVESTNLILPGSTGVSGRWISGDIGPVTGHLYGMGIDVDVPFTRAAAATYYSLALQTIDSSKVNTECITLDVYAGRDSEGNRIVLESGAFHGIQGSCS